MIARVKTFKLALKIDVSRQLGIETKKIYFIFQKG